MITVAVLFILALAGVKWAADALNKVNDRKDKLLKFLRRHKKPHK